jgi:hypothetical protein
MKRIALGVTASVIVALAGAAWGEVNKDAPVLRLELDLVDGSRIIGTPGIETVPVETSYAKMTVPLRQIRTNVKAFAAPAETERLSLLGRTTASIAGASVIFDNLKIWNYAKTDFNDRTEE